MPPRKKCKECGGGNPEHKKDCRHRCPTGKDRFGSDQEAHMVLTDAKISFALHGRKRRREQRVYYCIECVGFHLTSQP